MEWLVSLAQLIADFHVLSVRMFGALAEGKSFGTHAALVGAPYAIETLFCCWFVLTLVMGIRAQREYMRPKPPPKPSSDSLDRIILPNGQELHAEFDKWGRRTGDWLRPPPPPAASAPVEVVKSEEVVKQKPKIMVGGRERVE